MARYIRESCRSMFKLFLLFALASRSRGFSYGREEPNWGRPKKISSNSGPKYPASNENTQMIPTKGFPHSEIFQSANVQTYNIKDVPICKNATFCEQPPYYPEELVNWAVQMDKKYKYSASVDEIEESEDAESRIDLIDEVPVCASEVQIVYPKTAENRYNQWLFVVNHNKFMQGVRIEACRSELSDKIHDAPDGYVAVCKQQYVFRHLAAILPDGSMKMDLFRFPSGCRAYMRFDNPYDTGYRINS